MSGGIGPSSDIRLPNDPQQNPTPPQQQQRRFPSLWHLKCVAIIIVLAASGLVTIINLSVVVLSALYFLILSTYSFPAPPSPTSSPAPPIFHNSRILPIYVTFAGLVGLLLPILYIAAGIYSGDTQSVAAAAPHLFLLASQVVMEGVTASTGRFSIPIRAFVPVFYNSWRMPEVAEWVRWEVVTSAEERGGAHWMLYVGRGLALVNLGLWSFNLFGFLLPVYLPRAFKRYYSTILMSKVE